ncbi:uncharacterized protein LOC133836657 [Drosophila sulfurigaster albostrigata]|uniref:uncharacterized protein LOC133836657 n=1 Tax=Drosophila sulfurigaster albostrigata TaxID=89887 RepID=UPI002D219B52|nr:uncharacterized protein LOC133836657 [Drosophila sulfurigaster albostrigata]
MAARLGLVVANEGSTPTFCRPGCEGTIPDITLATERAANRLQEWGVLEDYTGSDHQYICFSINSNHRRRPDHDKKTTRRWNAKKLDTEKLIEVLDASMETAVDPRDARSTVRHTMRAIEHSCAAAMPKTTSFLKRKAAYWWNEQIAELRRACLRARRKMTRARSRSSATAEIEEHKEARKRLKLAIVHSKKSKWEELRNDINTNPWGLGYKIVTRKLGAQRPTPELNENVMASIVNTLFPQHERRTDPETPALEEPPFFTENELRSAATSLKTTRHPDPMGFHPKH